MFTSKLKSLLFPSQLLRQSYFFLAILILVPMILLAGIRQLQFYNVIKEMYEKELIHIAQHIEGRLPHSFDEIIDRRSVLHAPIESQVQVLNSELQPILDQVSSAHPNMGIGVYSIELDHVLAVAPNFDPSMLRPVPHTFPYFKVYEKKQPILVITEGVVGWAGMLVYNLAIPLYRDGRLVGHVWSNIKTEELDTFSKTRNLQFLLTSLVIYIIILFFTQLTYKRLSNDLSEFATGAIQGPDNIHTSIIPELQPMLDRIRKHQWEIRMNTVSQFAASVVHEVRNPITSIRGFSQLLLAKETDPQKREYLQMIMAEMDTVSEIVTAFLRFTKPAMPEVKRVFVQDLINDLENLTGAQILEARVRLTIYAEHDDIAILCDFNQLKQVLLNLIQNAFQAMEDRENNRLAINIMRRGKMVQIDICDNGPGIREEHMVKLFEPFFTTKGTGTGLGLCVCKQLLEQQGGSINVKSEVNQGTVFTIFLPMADEDDV